ncbi:unnamed protein product [Blepharisma stoltei]|uniref:Uncharacterized protein n=1 Tax=Blepharisma stoltei TaxID=1481888 RepID=A0AAU9J4M6_9CILI|nr:unnamed protein product [Blepharisma stoltei]
MEVPIILQHLKDYHQSTIERDEITHIREDIITFIHDFSKKVGLRGAYLGNRLCPDSNSNCYISKINNLLPKSEFSPRLKLFSLFAKFSSKLKINVNVPTTLIKVEEVPYIIHTKKEGSIQSKACTSEDFLYLTQKKNDSNCPLFCYKVPGQDTIAVFTIESAEKLWNNSEDNAFMQQYILGRSNTVCITRVLWKQGSKNKYYNIVNRTKQEIKSQISSVKAKKPTHKKSSSTINISDFQYRNMMLPTTQSLNNPYKIRKCRTPLKRKTSGNNSFSELPKQELRSCPSGNVSPLMTVKDDDSLYQRRNLTEELSRIIGEGSYKEFIVTTKDSDSCYAIETLVKIPEIENMVNQVVQFLNTEVFKNTLQAIVLDFLQDRNNNWFLLDCKEYLADTNTGIEKKKINIPSLHKSKRSRSLVMRKKNTSFEEDEEIKIEDSSPKEILFEEEKKEEKTLPKFKIKPKMIINEKPHINNEKELVKRCAEVNEKVDQIINKKMIRAATSNLMQSESPHPFPINTSFSQLSDTQNSSPISPLYKKRTQTNIKESLWDDKCHYMTKKHYSDIVDNFDEMTLNTQIAKMRKQNLVEKYGGDEFWNSFILSFYNKVLASEVL